MGLGNPSCVWILRPRVRSCTICGIFHKQRCSRLNEVWIHLHRRSDACFLVCVMRSIEGIYSRIWLNFYTLRGRSINIRLLILWSLERQFFQRIFGIFWIFDITHLKIWGSIVWWLHNLWLDCLAFFPNFCCNCGLWT